MGSGMGRGWAERGGGVGMGGPGDGLAQGGVEDRIRPTSIHSLGSCDSAAQSGAADFSCAALSSLIQAVMHYLGEGNISKYIQAPGCLF